MTDRDALLRWASRHRARAVDLRAKGKDRWAENNERIAERYEALADEAGRAG